MARRDLEIDSDTLVGWIGLGVIIILVINPWIFIIPLLIVVSIFLIVLAVRIYKSGINPKWNSSYTHFKKGQKLLKKNHYNEALTEFNKSINTKNITNGDSYFYRGLTYLKLGEKTKGLSDFEMALMLMKNKKSSNYLQCQNLIKKLEELDKKTQQLQTVKVEIPKKNIKLKTCSKKDILTLEGFDEIKAQQFIEARKQGKIWYDIDSFVMEFNIQPHQMIMLEDRIIFPPRPKTKLGKRKVDI